MRLQKNTSLALYSVLEFAIDPTRHIPAAEIAARYGVSPHHLAKVLSELARSGIVESVRGVGGGYRFAGNARRITLMDVIRLFEELAPGPNERREPSDATPVGMALGAVLSEIDEIAKATLSSITLATMLRLIERQQGRPASPVAAAPGDAPAAAQPAPRRGAREAAGGQPAPRGRGEVARGGR
ncbi:MAG: Rrf2 family transcriptional regulator [Lautropia sp.]|nr:MAG: Rrf2 family transcriptional regulator [Pseudomonadota bacterium]MBC6958926.1 Rrf2 family transcriptional regulator [Lautropia sp.]MCL4701074.1 Rrf2 family transcriptional regulator [Burkholderiaceae bacterium]MCZ2414337.1 Rrf2 family transcriptional regulator [Burkholderiales bacterium]MDL1908663.1 Rrf2 family transcriptional regulator [Betaproteobacteria bacterium PRO1]